MAGQSMKTTAVAGVVVAALTALMLGAGVGRAEAQLRRMQAVPRAQAPAAEPNIPDGTSPAELQRLFDAYALVQAQDVLQLTDAQLPDFMTRLRALQDVRRRTQNERARIVQDLRRLADQGRSDGAARDRIADRIRALREADLRGLNEVLMAADRLDEILEPVQQARLRVLEETIERRKLELLTRARQAARARRQR